MLRNKALIAVIMLFLTVGPTGAVVAAADRTVNDSTGKAVIQDVKPSDIPQLVKLLGHNDNNVRAQAAELLAGFGEEAVPALLAGLGADDTDRVRIIAVLTEIGDDRAVEPISMLLTDRDQRVSRAARGSLVAFGQSASHYMVVLLQDNELRDIAADILINIEPERDAVDMLRRLLDNDVPATRAAALYVLGLWDELETADTAIKLLKDGDPAVRARALSAYGRHAEKTGEYDQEALLGLLSDESAEVRVTAVRLLSKTPADAIIEPLSRLALNDPDPDVRDNALSVLGGTGDPDVASVLIRGLGDSNENSVISSLWYLDDLGAKEAVPDILALFEGGDLRRNELMVQEACYALAGLRQDIDLGIFLPYLSTGRAYDTRMAVLDLVSAIGRQGDSSLIASLEDYRAGENNSVILRRYDKVLEELR